MSGTNSGWRREIIAMSCSCAQDVLREPPQYPPPPPAEAGPEHEVLLYPGSEIKQFSTHLLCLGVGVGVVQELSRLHDTVRKLHKWRKL